MEKKTPKDFGKFSRAETARLAELQKILHRQEVFRFLHNSLIEIIGPLTVRERWELLGEIGLNNHRQFVTLEGSAYNVASEIITSVIDHYPRNLILIIAIAEKMGLGGEETTALRTFIDEFSGGKP